MDDEFIKSWAKRDFDNEDFTEWSGFDRQCQKLRKSYGYDYDEAGFGVYVDEYKKLCEENGISFSERFSVLNKSRGFLIQGDSITEYHGNDEVIVIPKNISCISGEAFKNCKSITTLVVQGALFISGGAFLGCSNLREIRFEGESNVGMNNSSFEGCLVEKIVISDMTELDYDNLYLFLSNKAYNYYEGGYYLGPANNPYWILMKYDDSNIENADIHSDTEEICYYAFKNCSKLKNVTVPKKIKEIYHCFRGCGSIKQIKLHNSVKKISERAFYDCISLEKIVIPPKVEKISIQTFHNCSSLTSVELPKKLTYIGELAFENCQSLEEIYIPETVKTIRANAFEGCSSLTILSKGGDYAERFAKKNKISYKRI